MAALTATAAASPHCYSKPGAISAGGRPQLVIWHDKVAIYSCRLEYVHHKLVAKKRRLGPRKIGTRVSYDGNSGVVAWANTATDDLRRTDDDRLWARSAWRTVPPAGRRFARLGFGTCSPESIMSG